MESKIIQMDILIEKAETYGKTNVELLKLKAVDKTADLISGFISKGLVFLFVFSFFVIVNIGLALLLGDLFGKMYLGFFCVAGFYGIVGLGFYLLRKRVKEKIGDSIVSQILENR